MFDEMPGVVHPEERHQHGQRQRNRHDQDRAEVHQEDDVRERDQRDLLDQRVRSVSTACSIRSDRS